MAYQTELAKKQLNEVNKKYDELRGNYSQLMGSFDQSEELRKVYKKLVVDQRNEITALREKLDLQKSSTSVARQERFNDKSFYQSQDRKPITLSQIKDFSIKGLPDSATQGYETNSTLGDRSGVINIANPRDYRNVRVANATQVRQPYPAKSQPGSKTPTLAQQTRLGGARGAPNDYFSYNGTDRGASDDKL